ncbi:MAG: hypothetical protein WBM83_02750, partial [Flavobacteriaceae bacterium]
MKQKVKKIVKQNPFLFKLAQKYSENALFKKSYSKQISGKNNSIKKGKSAVFINCQFEIIGDDNQITIAEHTFFKNVRFYIYGNNNKILISEGVRFNRAGELWIEDFECEIQIGAKST